MASKEQELFEKYFCEKYCDRHCSKGKMCSFKDYILSVNKKYLIDENTIGYGIKQMLNDLDRLECADKQFNILDIALDNYIAKNLGLTKNELGIYGNINYAKILYVRKELVKLAKEELENDK